MRKRQSGKPNIELTDMNAACAYIISSILDSLERFGITDSRYLHIISHFFVSLKANFSLVWAKVWEKPMSEQTSKSLWEARSKR